MEPASPQPVPVKKYELLKTVAKAAGILLLSLVLLLGLAVLAAWLLEGKIKAKIVDEVNAQITVPVKVEGNIELSLLKHFPYASLTFSKVSIDDKLRKGDKKLLRADEFSFLCNIYSLFGSEIEFTKVYLRGGELNLLKSENGKTNYDIFKPSAGSKNSLSIQLKKAQIKNTRFTYIDKTQATTVDIKLNDVALDGNFKDEYFLLFTKSNLRVNRITANGEDFLKDKNILAEVTLDVNKTKKKYNFRRGKISVDDTEFSITGFFASLKHGTQLSFNLLNSGKDMQRLFALFPEKYQQGFQHATGSGEYAIKASVNGTLGKNSFPVVELDADLKNSEIKLSNYNKLLKNVNATAKYELSKTGESKIVISNFNCILNNLPFHFQLTLDQFSNPRFNFSADGVLHLEELSSFIPDSVVQELGGTITFHNFNLRGQQSDFNDVENSTLTGSGQFELHEVECRQNGITYGNINGVLKYENQIVEAQNFTLNFLSTDFNFTGTIQNLFAFVYNLSAKRKSNDVVLGINGKVKTNTFALTSIIDAYDKKNRPRAQQREKINIRDILSMKGNLQIEMERFLFREMKFNKLAASLQLAPGFIQINQLEATGMGGNVRTRGLISFTPQNHLNLNLDITAVALNIPQIFKECENFDQTTLTDKHLKGTISTSVSLDATWLNYKELDMPGLRAIVDFKITNGELINFEPLRVASKFIKLEELAHIRFADLENTIKIADSRIDVPEFEIKTSALNLMFFGFHNFNNDVDYHFKINLHKLLAQKFTRFNNNDYIEEDPYQGLNIYLSMTGNLSNPVIKFDKPTLRKKIQADFKNEKEVLKNLLRNAPKKIDEQEQKREEKYFDVNEQPEFLDFDADEQ